MSEDRIIDIPQPVFKDIEPLKDELLPVESFPYEILPNDLIDWVRDNAELIGCPPDFIAVNAITVLSSLLGRKALIKPKHYDDWTVTPNLWGVIIGRPSSKKSPSMDAATKPINGYEMKARLGYKEALKDFKIEKKLALLEANEAQKSAMALLSNKKAKKVNAESNVVMIPSQLNQREQAKAVLKTASDNELEPPTEKRYIIHSATVEKLAMILETNHNGLLTIRDELTGWLKRLDSNENAEEREFYLMAFNGNQSYSYDRVTRDPVFIRHCICSVLGGIQPSKLLHYMRDLSKGLGDDGLFQRFQLMVYPDNGSYIIIDRYPNTQARQAAYAVFDLFNDLLEIPSEEESPILSFDPDAQKIFDEFQKDNLSKVLKEPNPSMESHLGKYPAMVASLALIIHIADSGAFMTPVSSNAIIKACAWADYLESHARRVYAIGEDRHYGAKNLIEKLPNLNSPFGSQDVIRKKWSGLEGSTDVSEAMNTLIEHGYLASRKIPTDGRTKIEYFINPKIEFE